MDIYPNGTSEYEMYEDDGLTREHREGVFATTKFEVKDNRAGGQPMEILINAAKGDFKERLKERVYLLEIHTQNAPGEVKVQETKLKEKGARKSKGASGQWSFDANDRGGVLKIWTGVIATDAPTAITVL
jgi:alpha-glucosidase